MAMIEERAKAYALRISEEATRRFPGEAELYEFAAVRMGMDKKAPFAVVICFVGEDLNDHSTSVVLTNDLVPAHQVCDFLDILEEDNPASDAFGGTGGSDNDDEDEEDSE